MQQTYTKIQLTAVIVVIALMGCASHDVTRVEDYNQFAIKAAQASLWNEAIFRWNQVISIEPDNAAAHNNLGVGYEALGKINQAVLSYKRATELEPESKFYRINYRRCRLHIRRSGIDTENISPESSEKPEE